MLVFPELMLSPSLDLVHVCNLSSYIYIVSCLICFNCSGVIYKVEENDGRWKWRSDSSPGVQIPPNR